MCRPVGWPGRRRPDRFCWSANRRFLHDLLNRPATDWSPALFVRTVANAVNGDISIARTTGAASSKGTAPQPLDRVGAEDDGT